MAIIQDYSVFVTVATAVAVELKHDDVVVVVVVDGGEVGSPKYARVTVSRILFLRYFMKYNFLLFSLRDPHRGTFSTHVYDTTRYISLRIVYMIYFVYIYTI